MELGLASWPCLSALACGPRLASSEVLTSLTRMMTYRWTCRWLLSFHYAQHKREYTNTLACQLCTLLAPLRPFNLAPTRSNTITQNKMAPTDLEQLLAMGFSQDKAEMALQKSGNCVL